MGCRLCPHNCALAPGGMGRCGARGLDTGGRPVSPYLGKFSAIAIDPIEKKPLRRFLPATATLSFGGVGCNMDCPFCQNWYIAHPEDSYKKHEKCEAFESLKLTPLSPNELVDLAVRYETPSVSFTYNEPLISLEYILACAPLLRERDVALVMVTNGMVNAGPLAELAAVCDAANVDLKAFGAASYARMGGDLVAVLATVVALVRAGVHVELTHLVVPGISGELEEFSRLVDWIAALDPTIPLHITRYRPERYFDVPPPPPEAIAMRAALAREKLSFVYG